MMNSILKYLGFNFPPEEKEPPKQIQPTFLPSEKEKYPYSDQIREKFFADLKKFPIEEWERKASTFGLYYSHPLLKYKIHSLTAFGEDAYIDDLWNVLTPSFKKEIYNVVKQIENHLISVHKTEEALRNKTAVEKFLEQDADLFCGINI